MAFQLDSEAFKSAPTVTDYLNQNRKLEQDAAINDEKIKAVKMEKAVKYLGMATPENWQAIRSQAIQEGLGNEETIPMQYDSNWIQKTRQAFGEMGANVPASIQNFSLYKTLSPEDQALFDRSNRGVTSNYLNLGGSLVNPNTGERLDKTLAPQDTPENKAAVKKAEEEAKIQAEREKNFPSLETKSKQILGTLKQLKEHQGKSDVVGAKNLFSGAVTSYLPFTSKDAETGVAEPISGTKAAGFNALLKQAKGQQFLQAFESLKGAGQITEVEGAKATSAISRMNAAQSEEEFDAAVSELEDIVSSSLEKQRSLIGGKKSTDTVGNQPATGGVKFLGFE